MVFVARERREVESVFDGEKERENEVEVRGCHVACFFSFLRRE